MDGILNSMSAVLLILLMAFVGFMFGKLGWMNAEHKKFVSRLLTNWAVPCMCVGNVFTSFTQIDLSTAGVLLLLPLLNMIVMIAVSLALAKLLRITRKRFGVFVVMCALSNSMFVGYPMCYGIFGDPGVPYIMMFFAVNSLVFWTAGCYLIYRSGGNAEHKFSLKDSLRAMLNPPLITLLVALGFLAVGFKPPQIMMDFVNYFGKTVTPLAMLYIGFIIYDSGLRNIRLDRDLSIMFVMRFVFSPVLMILLCKAFNVESSVAVGVFAVEAAMPVMANSVFISGYAGADEQYAAVGVSLTTTACFFVIPILTLFL